MSELTIPAEPSKDKTADAKDTSGLKFYSMGLVSKTPANFPSSVIEVIPIEAVSLMEPGPVTGDTSASTQQHADLNGSHNSQASMQKGKAVEAEWLPLSDSNRDTAPCVQKDESVILFKFADVQKYYWATLKYQPALRKKEVVRWSASNEDAPLTPHTRSTSYFVEFDAIGKKLELSTPSSGESVAYRVCMDVAAGRTDISDTKGNNIVLDSNAGKVSVTGKNDVDITAGKSINMFAPTTNVNSETINLNGAVNVKKALNVSGGAAISGGSGAAIKISGDIYGSGSLSISRINTNSVSEGSFSSQSVPQAVSQNSQASSAAAGWNPSYTPAVPISPEPVSAPSQTANTSQQGKRIDYAATANNSGGVLSGDKRIDDVKMATVTVSPVYTPNVPGVSLAKDTNANIGTPSQKIGSGKDNSIMSKISSTFSSIGSTIKTVVSPNMDLKDRISAVKSTTETVHRTVTDPINSVSRSVTEVVSSVSGGVVTLNNGVVGEVNGFIAPVTQAYADFGLAPPAWTQKVNGLSNKAYDVSYRLDSSTRAVTDPLDRVTGSISSITSTVQNVSNRADYAVDNVNNTATSLEESANKVSESTGQIRKAGSQVSESMAKTKADKEALGNIAKIY